MTEKKTKVKSTKKKTNLSMKELLEKNPDFESRLASLSKEFSEKVQELMSGSEIEATVRVSFSFNNL
jgi:hypothetical protein